MVEFLLASLVIFCVLSGWIWVQQRYQAFARRHPECGPFRAEGGSCGSGCGCHGGACPPPQARPAENYIGGRK